MASKRKRCINNDGMWFDSEEEMKEYEANIEYNRKRILKATGGKFVDFGPDRRMRTENQKYIIDKILPEGELHILAGASGVGKSTLLLPVLKAIQEGKPVWGLNTIATPLVYIMCDSSATSLQRKLQRLNMADWAIPGYALEDLRKQPFDLIPSATDLWDLPDYFPWAKLFVVEAFGWFYSDKSASASRDYSDMMRLWSRVRDNFTTRNLTIWGTTHTAKFKKGDGYDNPRDRVFGSVAQAASASTIMSLERDPEDKNKRILEILPRDSKDFEIEFGVDGNGVLQYLGVVGEREKAEEVRAQTSMRMFDAKLASYKEGEILLGSTIRTWYESMNFSRATVNRWLDARVKDGTLERMDTGVYKVHKITEQ